MTSHKRIVICGGGAIGAAIAYFTSRRGAWPTVIERHEVAGAASGKSGGFLALDWCGGSPLDGLARRSFELHGELSSELGDPWGYRRLTTYAGYAAEDDTARRPGGRPWLSDGVAITSCLGSPESTAVVEPRAFTTGLMRAAAMHGAVLLHGTVVDLVRAPSGAVRGVAGKLGQQVRIFDVSSDSEIDAAFATIVDQRIGGLIVQPDQFFTVRRDQLVLLTTRHAIPTIFPWREFVVAGGLMSYGTSLRAAYRQVAIYAGRILKGEKPADLPVQQATAFETVVNLKAAKALGVTIPTGILLRADEVIE
jgi:FAD dependent oxidoreductase/ABC transporter substrate binding protein